MLDEHCWQLDLRCRVHLLDFEDEHEEFYQDERKVDEVGGEDVSREQLRAWVIVYESFAEGLEDLKVL
jgi:hypothetical protein